MAELADEDIQLLSEMVRWYRAERTQGRFRAAPPQRDDLVTTVRIIGPLDVTAEAYPGIITIRLDNGDVSDSWEDGGNVWVIGANNESLVEDTRYPARPSNPVADPDDDTPVYLAYKTGDMGFVTHTEIGIVSLVDQYLGAGEKSVDGLRLPVTTAVIGASGDTTLRGTNSIKLGGSSGLLNATAYLEPIRVSGSPGTHVHAGVVCYHTVITTVPDQAWVNYAGEESGQVGSLYWKVGPLGVSSGAPSEFIGMSLLVCDTGGTPARAASMPTLSRRAWFSVAGVVEAVGPSAFFTCNGGMGQTGTSGGGDTVTGGIITTLGTGGGTDGGTWT